MPEVSKILFPHPPKKTITKEKKLNNRILWDNWTSLFQNDLLSSNKKLVKTKKRTKRQDACDNEGKSIQFLKSDATHKKIF